MPEVKMDDETIVRTLAEFMGWLIVDKNHHDQVLPPNRFGLAPGTHHYRNNVPDQLPDYLTSYDAIAPVYRRLSHEQRNIYEMRTSGAPDTSWTCGIHNAWMRTPRQHAEALATAILEAKPCRK